MISAERPESTAQPRRRPKVSDLSNVSADIVLVELTNQIANLSKENAILKAMVHKLRQQITVQLEQINSLSVSDK
jgi:cell division protein FtsB